MSLVFIFLAAVGLAFAVALSRANELFCLRVEAGAVHFLRGRLPPALLNEIRDVAQLGHFDHARIRGLRRGDRVELATRGLDAGQQQQLRNVVGGFPLAKILAGRPPTR